MITFFQVMLYFVKYMNETLIRGGDLEHLTDLPSLSEVYMLRWLRTKQSIVMCLSTGTVQVRLKGQVFRVMATRPITTYANEF